MTKDDLIKEIAAFIFKRLQRTYQWGRNDERDRFRHDDWTWLEEDAQLIAETIFDVMGRDIVALFCPEGGGR